MGLINFIKGLYQDPKERYNTLYKQYIQLQMDILQAHGIKIIDLVDKRDKLETRLEKAAKAAGEDFFKSYAHYNFISDEHKDIDKRMSELGEILLKDWQDRVQDEYDQLERKSNELTLKEWESLRRHLTDIS